MDESSSMPIKSLDVSAVPIRDSDVVAVAIEECPGMDRKVIVEPLIVYDPAVAVSQ
jgi:hypothetical protein